jgi:putative pyruvate formate lyase activating enzyme
MPEFTPAYVKLPAGELRRRAAAALDALADCTLCPRNCHANRLADKTGVCTTGRYAVVSSHAPHHGEEDCLRGTRGSGTIFFAWCNLRCVFCQNFEISWLGEGALAHPDRLAGMMLELQTRACHNINLVTPEHVVPQVLEALAIAAEGGLHLPIVYNTSAYDSPQSLALMDGVVDIYMPDFKFWDAEAARRYLKAPDYPDVARRAIAEMHRQVGPLVTDENGIAKRGVLLRHLVMPAGVANTRAVMDWVASELGPETYVNLMPQYYPAGRVNDEEYREIARSLSAKEFQDAIREAHAAGLYRLDHRSAARAW